jgi:hypothetical protein
METLILFSGLAVISTIALIGILWHQYRKGIR